MPIRTVSVARIKARNSSAVVPLRVNEPAEDPDVVTVD